MTESTEVKKCGHIPCHCTVAAGDTYCSEYCGDIETHSLEEISCQCGHEPCKAQDHELN